MFLNNREAAEGFKQSIQMLAGTGVRVNVEKGVTANSVCVALFHDPRGQRRSDSYETTILWGDTKEASGGTIHQSGELFYVSGSHTYNTAGNFEVTVQLADETGAVTIVSQATIGSRNERFVAQAYSDLLHHAPDLNHLSHWSHLLDEGLSYEQVIADIQRTSAYLPTLVQNLYEMLLLRPPDMAELLAALLSLERGESVTQLKANILSSQEYFEKRGQMTSESFLVALHHDVLGQAFKPNEVSRLNQQTDERPSRADIVGQVLQRPEARAHLVQHLHRQFWQSVADSENLDHLIDKFSPDASEVDISAALLASKYANFALSSHPILATDYTNPNYDTNSTKWTSDRVGGKTFLENDHPIFEWTPIIGYDPSNDHTFSEVEISNQFLVGLSGTVVIPPDPNDPHPELSKADVPFTHPFENDPESVLRFAWQRQYGNYGNDFTFDIAPDRPYWSLMATSGTDHEIEKVLGVANGVLHLGVPSVIHVEIDQGLMPPEYRPKHTDRAAVFGRWIIDDGHDSFNTEIHPPLLLATARPTSQVLDGDTTTSLPAEDGTHSTIVGRPYLVGQYFTGDRQGLRASIESQLYDAGLHPWKNQIDLNAEIMPGWAGSQIMVSYIVSPPTPRLSDKDQLWASYHFTVRHGVSVYVLNMNDDAVQVLVKFDSSYTPPPLPPPGGKTAIIHVEDLSGGTEVKSALDKLIDDATNGIKVIIRAHLHDVVDNGAHMTWYPRQIVGSSADSVNRVTIAVADLPVVGGAALTNEKSNGMAEGANQPYPIYGYLDVYWKRASLILQLQINQIRDNFPLPPKTKPWHLPKQQLWFSTYVKVRMGNDTYVQAADGTGLLFRTGFSFVGQQLLIDHLIAIQIEIWHDTASPVIEHGHLELINDTWYAVFPDGEQREVTQSYWDSPPQLQKEFLMKRITAPVPAGLARTINLIYDAKTQQISGDVVGSAGNQLHVPPEPNTQVTPEIWFTISAMASSSN